MITRKIFFDIIKTLPLFLVVPGYFPLFKNCGKLSHLKVVNQIGTHIARYIILTFGHTMLRVIVGYFEVSMSTIP